MSNTAGEQLTVLPLDLYDYRNDAAIAARFDMEREIRQEPTFQNGMKMFELRRRILEAATASVGLETTTSVVPVVHEDQFQIAL